MGAYYGIGELVTLAFQIYLLYVFFKINKRTKEMKEQQDRIEHNVYLLTQQQARIEEEMKQIKSNIIKED